MTPDDDEPTDTNDLRGRVRQLEQLCDELEDHAERRAHGNMLLFAGFVIGLAVALQLMRA